MQKSRLAISAKAFLEWPFNLLVNMLSLEPINGWLKWIDLEGNVITIRKNKSILLYPAKIPIQKTKDIFRKAHPSVIIKYSYWGMLLFNTNEQIFILLGNDGKLRSCLFKNGNWENNFCPLLLGGDILRYIVNEYLNNELQTVTSLKISSHLNFEIEKAYSFGIPVEDETIKEQVKCLLKNRDLME